MNTRIVLAALVGTIGVSAAAVGIGVAQGGDDERNAGLRPGDARALDSAPSGSVDVSAVTKTPGGDVLGVATYRNAAGLLCLAQGRVSSDERRLVDGRGRSAPVDQLGNCSFRAAPIGASVTHFGDDPTTSRSESATVISGLVERGVREIEVRVPGRPTQHVEPTTSGAFIVALERVSDVSTIPIRLHGEDGSRDVALPAPADPDELARRADMDRATPSAHP